MSGGDRPLLILVKHALPVLDPCRPAREWTLSGDGEAQAYRLVDRLRPFLPFRLAASFEPKALATAVIVGETLGIEVHEDEDLREFDRPVLDIVDADEHTRRNAPIFAHKDVPVLGNESANEALARFEPAVRRQIEAAGGENAVVVTHGTVMTLLAGQYNQVNELELWSGLRCPSLIVMRTPSLEIVEIVTDIAG